jgi:hypothetical protein
MQAVILLNLKKKKEKSESEFFFNMKPMEFFKSWLNFKNCVGQITHICGMAPG